MYMDIIWNEIDQRFYTIPDGDIASHKQIKDYYENKRWKYYERDN